MFIKLSVESFIKLLTNCLSNCALSHSSNSSPNHVLNHLSSCSWNHALNRSLFHLMNHVSNWIMKPFNESLTDHMLISRLHHDIMWRIMQPIMWGSHNKPYENQLVLLSNGRLFLSYFILLNIKYFGLSIPRLISRPVIWSVDIDPM